MRRISYWIFLFYVSNLSVDSRTVNITITNNINVIRFRNIINLFLTISSCPTRNYSINVIPYNRTAPFESPFQKNDYFNNIQLVFGLRQYFSPMFFGFKQNESTFKFMNTYVSDFYMDYPLQLQLMLHAVNMAVVEKDSIKVVVFVLNGSRVDPMEPWKPFNPMPFLSTFKGSINVQSYINQGDGLKICDKILSSRTTTIAMNLNRNGTLEVLTACNNKNLLYWRMRWMVFFSSLSFANPNVYKHLPMRSNFTLFDFSQSNDFNFATPQVITGSQDITLSDITYLVIKLMDFSECNQPRPALMKLRTGFYSLESDPISRFNWTFDIYRNNGTFNKIGGVVIQNRVITMTPWTPPPFDYTLANLVVEMRVKNFRVAVMNEKPFAFNTYVNGTQVITGYCVEMITTILNNLNVTFNITFHNISNGILSGTKLDGMLGLLQNGQADIAVGPITLNTNFKPYVDFTDPFYTYKVAIIYKVNVTNVYQDIFEFINAFHWHVWILIISSCVIYAAALTLVNMISPNEAKFGFLYSFLFTMGSMVQGVTTALPDKISGRILVVFWWIFNIVVLLAYVANYGAILTNRRMQATITQLSDLFQQNQYSYATVTSSAIDYYLQNSPYSDIQNVYQVIRNQYFELMAQSTEKAIQNVQNQGFAFIYSDVVLKNYTDVPCMTVTNGTDNFSYSFALPLNSDFTNIINAQMANLSDSYKQILNNKYFRPYTQPVCVASSWLKRILDILSYAFLPNIIDSLNINKFAGIFVVMLIGIVIALFVAIIEFIVRKCRKNESED